MSAISYTHVIKKVNPWSASISWRLSILRGNSHFYLERKAIVKQTGQLREFKTLALIFKTEREISFLRLQPVKKYETFLQFPDIYYRIIKKNIKKCEMNFNGYKNHVNAKSFIFRILSLMISWKYINTIKLKKTTFVIYHDGKRKICSTFVAFIVAILSN